MCVMHVHRQSIHISLYTMYTTVCIYVYINIRIYMHSCIHSDKIINNGPGWQVPRQVCGKPSLNPGTKWCDLRPRNDDKPLDLDGKCGGWCTFTPGHTPRWVQTVPQLWDSTRQYKTKNLHFRPFISYPSPPRPDPWQGARASFRP